MFRYLFTIILFALLFFAIWWFWSKDPSTKTPEKIITDITQETQTTAQIRLVPIEKTPEVTIKNTADGLLIKSINNQKINQFITKNKVDSYKVDGSIIKFIETENGSKKIKYFNITELE